MRGTLNVVREAWCCSQHLEGVQREVILSQSGKYSSVFCSVPGRTYLFVKARVQYMEHMVGYGRITPLEAKVEAIRWFPVPTCPRSLRSFLGVEEHYHRLCQGTRCC